MNEPFHIPRLWEVPEVFRGRLGDQIGRQRVMEADDHLLLVLHAPPTQDRRRRLGRLFWRTPEGVWRSDGQGAGITALETHLEDFEKAVAELDRREEKAASATDYRVIMEELSPLLRTVRHLHRTLQEARELASDDRALLNIRDRAYQLERAAELLMEECRMSLECLTARRNEEQAEAGRRMAISAHRLNIMAAIFLPIATLADLFGTGLRHGLEELAPPLPFLTLVAVGFAAGISLATYIGFGGGKREE